MFNSTSGRTYYSDLPEKKYYQNYPLSNNSKYKRNKNSSQSARLADDMIDAVADTGSEHYARFPNHGEGGVLEAIKWTT
jgi:hypothetical protein